MERNNQDQILRLSRRIKEFLGADNDLPVIVNGDGNIIVNDTRSNAPTTDIGDRGARFDFKANDADGLNDGGSFHGVLTFQQWNDPTGGSIHQVGFTDNGNIWHRKADIGGAWDSSWAKVWDSKNSVNPLYVRLNRYHASDGTTINDATAEHGFDYNTAGSGIAGPFISFGYLAGGTAYRCQIVAQYNNDGLSIAFRTRNGDSGQGWNPWRRFWHDGNLNPIQGVSDGSYYGIKLPDGGTSSWLRTTINGIIPYQSGGASALGTSGWPFNYIYSKAIYINNNAVWHNGNYQFRTGQCTLNDTTWTQVNFTSAMSGTPRVTGSSNQDISGVRNFKARSVTASGFQGILGGTASGSTLCDYIAVWQ